MAQLGPLSLAAAIMLLAACSSDVDHPRAGEGSTGSGGGTSGATASAATGSGGSAGASPADPCAGLPCGTACCEDPGDPCFSPGNSRACDVNGACVEAVQAIESCSPPTECCTMDWDCGDAVYVPCVSGVCKQPLPDACWVDAECPEGCVCQGAFVCPCGYDCDSQDVPGACACDQTGG